VTLDRVRSVAKRVVLLVALLAVLVKLELEGMDGVRSVAEPLGVLLAVVELERMDGIRVRSVVGNALLAVLPAVGMIVLLILVAVVIIDEVLQNN
jgi:hypothetical protein